jgi:hypothetical protein
MTRIEKHAALWLLVIGSALPALLLVYLIARYAVNTPFADDWDVVALLEKAHAGHLTVVDLFAQHNEHRMFFPNLLTLALALPSHWDLRLEMYASAALAAVSFLAVYGISRTVCRTASPFSFALTTVASSALVFSLAQIENWLWGFQTAWLAIQACLTLGAFVLSRPSLPVGRRLGAAVLLCTISSFSSAQGLLVWPALAVTVAALPGTWRQKAVRTAAWMVLFVLCGGLYHVGFVRPPYLPSARSFIEQPGTATLYFLTLLGTAFNPMPGALTWGTCIGLAALATFALLVAIAARAKVAAAAAPWISLGLFSVLFAAVTMVGRSGFGIGQAESSRYTTGALYLYVAIAQLLLLLGSRSALHRPRALALFPAVTMAAVALLVQATIAQRTGGLWPATEVQREQGQLCLNVLRYLQPGSGDEYLQINGLPPAYVRDRVYALDRMGFWHLPRSLRFAHAEGAGALLAVDPGNTAGAAPPFIQVRGWVRLAHPQPNVTLVLLSYGSERMFIGSTFVDASRPWSPRLHSGDWLGLWQTSIPTARLPAGGAVLRAWVYDPSGGRFVALAGKVVVSPRL